MKEGVEWSVEEGGEGGVYIIPILFATSKASKSVVNFTYAFLRPSGRISVFTFWISTSYNSLLACLILLLVVDLFTRNTRVFSSSIFFMACSVVTGASICWLLSLAEALGTAFR